MDDKHRDVRSDQRVGGLALFTIHGPALILVLIFIGSPLCLATSVDDKHRDVRSGQGVTWDRGPALIFVLSFIEALLGWRLFITIVAIDLRGVNNSIPLALHIFMCL